MSDNVKTFTVSASAAGGGGTRKRKRRSTVKGQTMKVGKEQHGGTSPGVSLQVEGNRAPGGAEPPSVPFQKSSGTELTKTSTESSPAPVSVSVSLMGGGKSQVKLLPKPTLPLALDGGSKPVKVILEKKTKGTRVVLAPTKVKKLNPTVSGSTKPHGQTRKMAKKIRMSLGGFGKRVTRANTIRVDAKKQTIGDVKKTLVDAKLIKETSKAPEGVLRQMYSDYMMLKNRAL